MQYRKLGSSALEVSEICLGTMTWGEQNTLADAREQFEVATAQGVNFFDAAEMYPVPPRAETQGRTESILGECIKGMPRDRIVVATKITAPGRGFGWVRGGPTAVDLPSIREALDGSLRRLQTDYVDLYQIHWPDRYVPTFGKVSYDPASERPTVPIQAQLEAFHQVVKEGKVRYIGVSNETAWGLCEFVRIAREQGLPVIASVQNAYNLLNRAFEASQAEVHRHLNVPLLAYSPLAFGHLSGKYLDGGQPDNARLTRFPAFGQRYTKANVAPAVAQYRDVARRFGVSLATLSLAFVRQQWFTASTIIGATTLDQLRENLASVSVTLDADCLTAIDEVYWRYPNPAV